MPDEFKNINAYARRKSVNNPGMGGIKGVDLQDSAARRIWLVPVANLAAGASLADQIFMAAPSLGGVGGVGPNAQDPTFTIVKVSVLSQGAAAGIDNANTLVVNVKNGSNVLATKTYNATNTFPANNAQDVFATPTAGLGFADVKHGDLLTVGVVGGGLADPPAFVVQIEAVPKPTKT